MPVRWTLRSQVIFIAVATVTVVLAASQWVGSQFASVALEEDLEQRARIVLNMAARFWEMDDQVLLQRELEIIDELRRQVVGVDVFEIGDGVKLLATSRKQTLSPTEVLGTSAVSGLKRKEVVRTTLPEREGAVPWRLAAPLERDGNVVGAVQVEVWPTNERDLKRRLYAIGTVFLISSVVLISLLLVFILERRVARPVAALRNVMEQAQRGDLRVRASIKGGDELGFLASGFNNMLAQIAELNTGLQTRVEEATQELARRNRELQQINEKLHWTQLESARRAPLAAVGQMASTIAHELGTPLNSILGYTQLLLRQEMSPDQRAKLTIIESQISRMIETIRGVLDRTRAQIVPRAAVEVSPLVDEALAFVSRQIADAGLNVRTEIPGDLPLVQADAVGLRQILVNLLTNAIDATDRNGTITVRATIIPVTDGMGGQLELAVDDTGKGLRPDELQRIFEPFYTTKEPGSGTGLGLAIVNQIAADHGGRVLAESEPGRGTTIRVQLPLGA